MTRRALALCIGTTLVAVVLVALLHAPLASVEDQFTALKYKVRGTQPADSNIVVVYIDNEAIKTLGWPVRRNFYALMVKILTDLHVKAIGIEIQFEDPRLDFPEFPEYDDLLANVLASSNNVVLASYFDAIGGEADTAGAASSVKVPFAYPRVNGSLPEGRGLHLPLQRFLNAAAGVGHVNFTGTSGFDIPLLVHAGSAVVPAFAAELLRVYTGADRSDVVYSGGSAYIDLHGKKLPIETSSDATVQLNLPSSFSAFTHYPFLEVLRSYDALRVERSPSIPVTSFRNKVVLLGVIAEGRSEFRATPVDARFPSIGLQATFLDNALRSGFLHTASSWFVLALCLAVGLACGVMAFALPVPLNQVASFGLLIAVFALSFILFSTSSYVLPLSSLLFVGIVSAVSGLFYRQRQVKDQVHVLEHEKEAILSQLRDREAKVALLERELLEFESEKKSDKTGELMEEIRRYKAEIHSLSSRAEDLEVYHPVEEETEAAPGEFEGIIYDTGGKMKPVIDFIMKIAASDAPVLILGESGTGKELVARAIHRRSNRSKGPFIPVNCGALSESLLESELFGHERGAFTGAVKDKPGRFEIANGGTIFLDEIGEVSESFQLKLLRVLQEGELDRVGGTATIRVNVRVLAATNRDLKQDVAQKRFREDLYYRLNVLAVALPPLRERKSDIPLLVDHFLRKEGGDMRVSRTVMDLLQNHEWKGNIRELESTIRRAVLLGRAEKRTMVNARDLNEEIAAAARTSIAVQEQILESMREKGFSRSAITDTATELGGLNRGTVAEYFRGECLKAFSEQRFDLDAAVRHISLSADDDVNDRVRKKLREYLLNISEAVVVSQPWENSAALLRPKTKNLPQRYHTYLQQIAEAYYRGLWKPDADAEIKL